MNIELLINILSDFIVKIYFLFGESKSISQSLNILYTFHKKLVEKPLENTINGDNIDISRIITLLNSFHNNFGKHLNKILGFDINNIIQMNTLVSFAYIYMIISLLEINEDFFQAIKNLNHNTNEISLVKAISGLNNLQKMFEIDKRKNTM